MIELIILILCCLGIGAIVAGFAVFFVVEHRAERARRNDQSRRRATVSGAWSDD